MDWGYGVSCIKYDVCNALIWRCSVCQVYFGDLKCQSLLHILEKTDMGMGKMLKNFSKQNF